MRTIRAKRARRCFGEGVIAVLTLAAALNAPAAESTVQATPGSTPGSPKLKDLPANTWVKLAEEASGARAWPMFNFDPKLGKFVLIGGGVRKGSPAHFDTEMFDLATGKWVNAYPRNAPYKNEFGPTDAPGAGIDTLSGKEKSSVKADLNGVIRIARDQDPLQMSDANPYSQWAYNREDGKLYAYFLDSTLAFDPTLSQWTDLKAAPFSKSIAKNTRLVYGSLAYDPVNKEILSIGGTSDEDGGTPGTWLYSLASNEWKKLSPGSPELKALNAEAVALHSRTAAFVNACRNRFYVTESEAEAKADLAAGANGLAAEAGALAGKLNAAKLGGFEKNAPEVAGAEIGKVAASLKALAGKLGGPVTSELLVEARSVQDATLRAERALDTEPCGRGVSQLAVDPVNGKIVLFGGCRLDSYLADTWVYDCKTRSWEQRYPKVSPLPRAGHTLAWLPKSGKVVLYGGAIFSCGYGVPHGNPQPPRDLWSYDIAANAWKLLAQPAKEAPIDGVGAVDANDVLVVVSRDAKKRQGRVTWGMKVGPAAPDAGSAAAGVAPGAVTVCFNTPTDYDKATKPNPEGIAQVLKDLPANQWTLLPKPPKKTNEHGWGTCLYDPVRQQLLFFGGAHGPWQYTDIGHYSLRSATWSTGYADEYPFVSPAFNSRFNQTFNNHPCIPGHVWDSGACDSLTGKAIYAIRGGTWVYDPATREWEYPPAPKPFHSYENELRVSLSATPRGVVAWAGDGALHLFDAKARTWTKLPVNGGKLGGAYGDATGFCHDAKRNCLWLARDGVAIAMSRYDMESGALTTTPVRGPERVFMRETAYIPEIDMLLNLGRVKGPGGEIGNLAYDIENKKWIGLALPCSDGQPRLYDNQYWPFSMGLHYDPKLKVAILEHGTQEILVLRIDGASLRTFEVRLQEPKAK